ncbi:MAG: OmpA/MotB family protein [Phycisphaerales bacterium]
MQGKMNGRVVSLVAVCAAGFVLVGCDGAKKEVSLLKEENAQLSMQLDETRTALDGEMQERRRLEQELSNMKKSADEKPVEVAQATETAPPSETVAMPDLGPDVSVEQRDGAIVLTIASDVLFDSGEATLKTSAKKTLDKVIAEINKKFPEKQLRIAGFTDQDPIKSSGYKTNYHLGFDRAYNVSKYLETKGVSKDRLERLSFGPEQLKKSKKDSRRVEIAIVGADSNP